MALEPAQMRAKAPASELASAAAAHRCICTGLRDCKATSSGRRERRERSERPSPPDPPHSLAQPRTWRKRCSQTRALEQKQAPAWGRASMPAPELEWALASGQGLVRV